MQHGSLDNVDQYTNSYLETVPFRYITSNQFPLYKTKPCSTFLLTDWNSTWKYMSHYGSKMGWEWQL